MHPYSTSISFLKLLITTSLLLTFSYANAANLISPAIKSDIERDQQERLKRLQETKLSLESITPSPELDTLSNELDKQCYQIDKIKLTGNSVFSDDKLLGLLNFQPRCIGINSINNMLKIITNIYVEQGYVTSRAFLTPQDLTSGVLEIVIIEGKLEKILFKGKDDFLLIAAFPFMTGKTLNLRDLEQGLDQINRLARYNAQIKILPGSEQGYSVVDIQSIENPFWGGGVGFNNGGQESTGETQVSANVSAENMIWLLDRWSLSGSKNSEFATSFDSENVNFSLGIPFGYWNIDYRTSYSRYLSSFESNGFIYDFNGQTNNHNLDLKWLFNRNSISKSSVKFSLNHQRSKNYLLDILLTNSSRKLSSYSVSLDHSTRLGKGFLTISPQYIRGVDWLNAESDGGKSGRGPLSEFDKGTLTLSYSYPFLPSLSYSGTLYGQWSNDTLYGNQRLSIGGEYSVRGFKETSISGDEGYYWRNDLTYFIATVPILGNLSAQWALDTGTIAKDKVDAFEKGSLMGTSLTLRSRLKNLSSSLSIGAPLQSPSRLEADDYVLYYRIDLAI